MKYQQLENLESDWKWKYLIRKHREGEPITKYIEESQAQQYIEKLHEYQHRPEMITQWLDAHLNPELSNRLKQTIRAKRKRYFNAEQQHLRKKSIDLNFLVWQKLSKLAKKNNLTLSEMITRLIDDAEHKKYYSKQLSVLKENLSEMLTKDIDNKIN